MMAERRPFILRLVFGMIALAMVAALILVGCSGDAREPAKRLSQQRTMLSEGYSLLYADAAKIDKIELVLYVKIESQEFNDVITAIGDYGGELKKNLEHLAADYPGVRIDLVPLPEMERRKRIAMGKDRLLQFIPFGGVGRVEYERTLLISLVGALNHESHLCRVMAAEEPDPGLKKFLLDAEQRYVALHQRALGLLNREHFRTASKS